jgi:putative flippase GtrA
VKKNDSTHIIALSSHICEEIFCFIFSIEDNCVSLHFVWRDKLKNKKAMNTFLQNLGLILIVLASVLLILSHFLGWNNINAIQFGSFGAMIVGLVLYIWLNKKYQ